MIFFFLKAACFLLGHIPHGAQKIIAALIGRLVYHADSRHKCIVLENLERAFGASLDTRAKTRLTKKIFTNLALTFMEFTSLAWLSESELNSIVSIEGLEHVERALKKGRGIMFTTGHFGNWELMAVYMSYKIGPVHVVVRQQKQAPFNNLVTWIRTRSGNRVVEKKKAMRPLMKVLRSNGKVGIHMDQNVARKEGVFIDFFGSPACTNKGPAMLAASCDAAVLPIFIVREKGGHRIIIKEEILVSKTGNRETDAEENTAKITKSIEQMIKDYPEQWFWVHQRWKTRPQADN